MSTAATPEMTAVPGGAFSMGTEDPRGYPADGEGPVHEVTLDPFELGVHTVTNAEFATFVEATDHRTTAETLGDSFVFGGLLPDDFPPTQGPPPRGGAWSRAPTGAIQRGHTAMSPAAATIPWCT